MKLPFTIDPSANMSLTEQVYQGLKAAIVQGVYHLPEDVKVVTHSNRGLGPFWIKPLTRLEMNPVAQGDAVAKAVLTYFRTGSLPAGLVLGSEWKSGKTF